MADNVNNLSLSYESKMRKKKLNEFMCSRPNAGLDTNQPMQYFLAGTNLLLKVITKGKWTTKNTHRSFRLLNKAG